jgi:hypothetical protein
MEVGCWFTTRRAKPISTFNRKRIHASLVANIKFKLATRKTMPPRNPRPPTIYEDAAECVAGIWPGLDKGSRSFIFGRTVTSQTRTRRPRNANHSKKQRHL